MAFDHYKLAEPLVAGFAGAKKGIAVFGGGTCAINFFKPVDYNSGLTIGAQGFETAAAEEQVITGTVQGTIVPISVHTLVRVDTGTTVYKLA